MKRVITVALVALLLTIVVVVGVFAQSGPAGYFDIESNLRVWQNTVFRGQVNALQSLTVTNQLVSSNDAVVADDLTVGDVAALGKLRASVGATQTISFDTVITTTHSYLLVSAGEAVGTSSIGACSLANQGDVLAIENISSNAITITDTGTLKLAGNAALGQWDSLLLFCDGTNWVQFATANN